jgi:hypothetical protein
MREDADTNGPIWESVEEMLNDLAAGLVEPRSIGGWQPVAQDGALTWEPVEG